MSNFQLGCVRKTLYACLGLGQVVLSLIAIAGGADGQGRRETSRYTIGPSIQPLVIFGEGWSQRFTIINVDYYDGGEPTTGTLRFYTRTGEPWRLPIRDRGAVDSIPINLKSGEMASFETEVSQQAQQLGWALFDLPSSNAWGIYHSFTTFRKQTAGAPDLMTSVPFFDDLEDVAIVPFDNTGGKYHGLGIVNSGTRSEDYRFEAYDVAGTLRKTFFRTVPARNLQWFSLSAEHPELAGIVGQIKISTGGFRVAAFTLQFAPNGAFTAIPPVHTYGFR